MRGMRPPTPREMVAIADAFSGANRARDLCLFCWLYYLGWRISELLSLRWGDALLPGGDPQPWITLQRRHRKGRREGITQPVTKAMALSIGMYRDSEVESGRLVVATQRLWPFSRQAAWKILSRAYEQAGLGRRGIGCHGVRKRHGLDVYVEALSRLKRGEGSIDPMRAAARSLGHSSVASTEHYLPIDDATVTAAREAMPCLVDTLSIERNGARENRPVSMCPLQST